MGRTFDAIPDRHVEWLERQPVYFVATAPRADDGHLNVSHGRPEALGQQVGERGLAELAGRPG